VWVAVMTRARRLPTLRDVKKRILFCALVLAVLVLAGLGVVRKGGRLVLGLA